MNSERRRPVRRVALAVAWLIGCCAAAGADAAQFSLNQTRVHLNRARPVETLVLTNQEPSAVSFEVEVKRWRQGPDGRWELMPSDALVVHPLILTVPAGGQARLRVGTLSPVVAAEEAFRIELQQLAGANQGDAVQIRMLTRLSVPVFVQPPTAKPQVAIAVTGLDATSLTLALHNRGSGYFAPQQARLRVTDVRGRAVFEDALALGYALAGAGQPVSVKLPDGTCERASRIELSLDKSLPPLEAPIAASVRRCGR